MKLIVECTDCYGQYMVDSSKDYEDLDNPPKCPFCGCKSSKTIGEP